MFRCQDKGKNKIKVNDLLQRGQIFKIIRFWGNWAQINQTNVCIQKMYRFIHLQCQELVGNQGVKGHSLCGVYGGWPLTHPLTYIRTLYIWQTIPFLNQHSSPINLSPFSMRSDHFENLTPVRKVADLFPLYSFILTMKHCMDII